MTSGDLDPPHMGNIENAAGCADVPVFLMNGAIHDGHLPAGEVDELSLVSAVE